MKKTAVLGFLLLVFSTVSFAQPMGRVLEGQTFPSKILGKNARYTIYFPPGYEASTRKYPVVYLLHGYGDSDNGWVQFGEINRQADAAILSGQLPPMLIVMPDGERSWYINSYDGKSRYEDFFVQELIPEIEQKYPVRAEKRFRGIAGLSMGGYGTLIMAMKHPELFAACAPLSAAVWTDEEINAMPLDRFSGLLTSLYGSTAANRLTEHYYKNSILKIAETAGTDQLKSCLLYTSPSPRD